MSQFSAASVAGPAYMPTNNANLTALVLTTAAADWAVYNVHYPMIVRRLTFKVSTTITCGLVAPVVTFWKRPTSGSTVSQVSLGTLTIATTTATTKVVYKDISAVRIDPGQDLVIATTTAGTDSGTAAGAGFGHFVAELAPEYVTNLTNYVAST